MKLPFYHLRIEAIQSFAPFTLLWFEIIASRFPSPRMLLLSADEHQRDARVNFWKKYLFLHRHSSLPDAGSTFLHYEMQHHLNFSRATAAQASGTDRRSGGHRRRQPHGPAGLPHAPPGRPGALLLPDSSSAPSFAAALASI